MAQDPSFRAPNFAPTTKNFSHLPQMGKNYMNYKSGGSYDDPQYDSFATADYESQETRNAKSHSLSNPYSLKEEYAPQPKTEEKSTNKGFHVVNPEAIGKPPTQSSSQQGPESNNYYQCPACREIAISACGCEGRDAVCPKGHIWHLGNGKRNPGNSKAHMMHNSTKRN